MDNRPLVIGIQRVPAGRIHCFQRHTAGLTPAPRDVVLALGGVRVCVDARLVTDRARAWALSDRRCAMWSPLTA